MTAVELLAEDDDLTDAFLAALVHTFLRFSSRARQVAKTNGYAQASTDEAVKSIAWLKRLTLSDAELDEFAKVVNDGKTMSDGEKEEIREYFDVDDEQRLTFAGFCEMYNLQTTSSPDETWKDLRALGFDERLKRSSADEADTAKEEDDVGSADKDDVGSADKDDVGRSAEKDDVGSAEKEAKTED